MGTKGSAGPIGVAGSGAVTQDTRFARWYPIPNSKLVLILSSDAAGVKALFSMGVEAANVAA